MVGDLGFLSNMKTFHAVESSENCNLVFDSTTQNGHHVNCVVLTTLTSSHLVSLKRLPGGVCRGFTSSILRTPSTLAKVGSLSTGESVGASLNKIISKMKCYLTRQSSRQSFYIFATGEGMAAS